MNILSIDPSGNHISEGEGSGTTGIAYLKYGNTHLTEVKASNYETIEEYWHAIENIIRLSEWDHVVIEGYKLYNHAGMAARTQANSKLQTSQLIGVLRMACWRKDIKFHTQYASDVKSRWKDSILQKKGYLEEKNYHNGKPTNDHMRDALRHLVHFEKYKLHLLGE